MQFYHPDQRDESNESGGLNSPWAMIAGLMKSFNLSKEQILWEYSWLNLVMMAAPYSGSTKKEGKTDTVDDIPVLPADSLASFFGVQEGK